MQRPVNSRSRCSPKLVPAPPDVKNRAAEPGVSNMHASSSVCSRIRCNATASCMEHGCVNSTPASTRATSIPLFTRVTSMSQTLKPGYAHVHIGSMRRTHAVSSSSVDAELVAVRPVRLRGPPGGALARRRTFNLLNSRRGAASNGYGGKKRTSNKPKRTHARMSASGCEGVQFPHPSTDALIRDRSSDSRQMEYL